MILKILLLTSAVLVCEGTFQDQMYFRRTPFRFWANNQGIQTPPNTNWNYQIVNGRPVISGFPSPNAYVAFGLNPQTGQIDQTQIITQARPGGPVINMIQNMLHVAGQFFGQLTGAFGNAVGGALQTAGQFGQDLQDLTKPVLSVTGISRPPRPVEPIQQPSQPSTEDIVRPPVIPSAEIPSVPSVETPSVPSVEIPSTPSIQNIPEEATPETQTATRVIDQAIISFQTFRTNVQSNLQSYLETEEGEKALSKINENIDWAVNKLQNLRETAIVEPNTVLQTGRNTINAAFDNVEAALVGVTGTQGREFIEPTRNELIETFNSAQEIYEQIGSTVNSATAIPATQNLQ